MSRVYFHSPSGGAELQGPERHYAAQMIQAIATEAANPHEMHDYEEPLRLVLMGSPYFLGFTGERFNDAIRMMFGVGDEQMLRTPQGPTTAFIIALNTAHVVGSDAVKLLTRMHAQCESHAYVEGKNRRWLGNTIRKGRRQGILRPHVGWESVITLLRERDDEPVVMSYSITDSFPSPTAADNAPNLKDSSWVYSDRWWEIPEEERWEWAMEGLRNDIGYTHEIRPYNDDHGLGNFWDYHYGNGVNAFQLREYANELARTKAQAT